MTPLIIRPQRVNISGNERGRSRAGRPRETRVAPSASPPRAPLNLLAGLAILATACDERSEKTFAPAASSASAKAPAAALPPGLSSFRASIDGEPVIFQAALASSRASSLITVELSPEPVDCAAVAAGRQPAAESLRLEVVPELTRGGAQKHKLKVRSYRGPATSKFAAFELVDGDVASRVRIRLEGEAHLGTGKTMLLAGEIDAEPCGQLPLPGGAEPHPQPELQLSISGRTFGVTGAILRARPERRFALELSSAPSSCSGDAAVGDVELRLTGTLAPLAVESTYLYGDVLAEHQTPHEVAGDVFRLEVGDESDGKVPIEVSGSYDHDGYRVEVSGKVEALSCSE